MSDTVIHLEDYRPPAWRVPEIALTFDLGIDATIVEARMRVACDAGNQHELRLDGENLELLELRLDGRRLGPLEHRLADGTLEIPGARDGSVVETRVRLHPADNSALQGLYLSGSRERGFLLTQCEAEGFRRITFFPDRPDVLARYTVTLRADAERFPVLLAGGNPDGSGTLPDGRHWARFADPWPKPSYLFALVAGRLESIERDFTTAEGRAVQVRLWSEAETISRCGYAMEALLRAMRWDEERYGRCYDLDVFHVVATQDFNMGAMENKGLNVFNAKYLLADPDSSTDEDYGHVESVIGHEYFHNWSGNRVTCRDWFQLSLKEGFTVFREQSFSAEMNSPALQRIADVGRLRRAQFPEDAGPLAHPVRPPSYREIDNFYTATVYEKGAELIRMVAGRLGPEAFRRGTDLYFSRNDGNAATIEDFLAALGEASGINLAPYLAWYAQAGTPRLHAAGEYDTETRRYTLELAQSTPPTPGQLHKQPLPIPVSLALFDDEGRLLPLRLTDEATASGNERVVELTGATQRFVFEDVPARPIVSLLRGFSAPVLLEDDAGDADLALLLRHEPDGFNRWQAGQRLARRAFAEHLDGGDKRSSTTTWCDALAATLENAGDEGDPARLAELLAPPSETELGEEREQLDPQAIHDTREALLHLLLARLDATVVADRYRQLHAEETGALDAPTRARRHLKNRLLGLLCRGARDVALPLAAAQFDAACCMTDRIAALTLLLHFRADQTDARVAAFRQRHAGDRLALDKCLVAQATIPGEPALGIVEALSSSDDFTLRNPNRVQSLLGAFAHGNPSGFHRVDGAAYVFIAGQLAELDAINPTSAARLANAFNGWTRLEPVRRRQAHAALQSLAARSGNSRGLAEMLGRLMQGAAETAST